MSIFNRRNDQQTTTAPTPAAATQVVAPDAATLTPAAAAPGVVPPPTTPTYSMRPPEAMARADGETQRLLAEKRRMVRESAERAQASADERARAARSAASAARAPVPGTALVKQPKRTTPTPPARHSFDAARAAQTGLLNLAWSWQAAGAPIRAIHTYMQVLHRYPATAAADAAVADLVELSEKLAGEGQFHTALAIYQELEHLT